MASTAIEKDKEGVGDNEGIGDVLRLLRESEKLTIQALASKIEISPAYISEIETNKKKPNLKILSKYSALFGMEVSEILFFDEERKREKYDHRKLQIQILKKLLGEE